ncbi:MAG: D-alanine--D-alanine ligase [Planctomycetaceae bacterium]
MRIGLTYDLRSEYLAMGYSPEQTAEFDRDDTIDSIATALQILGHQPDRIGHLRQLVQRLAAGDSWDLVFNICEGLSGPAREAQVPALLEAWNIPCTFSDSLMMAVCLHKGLTKTLVAQTGLATAQFHLVETPADIAKVSLPYPLFAKPVSEGTGKGVSAASVIASPAQLDSVCRELLDRFSQPVLVETYLPGREFTVGLLGSGSAARVLGTLEVCLLDAAEPGAYSYLNKERCEELVEYRLVRSDDDPEAAAAEALALAAWKVLKGRDAGRIDIRSDHAGRPHFIESNPLAGLHPEHSDLPMIATAVGMKYVDLIGEIVNSAASRRRSP